MEPAYDLARYQKGDSIFDALATTIQGHYPVRLVRMTWLIQQRGSVLPRRQELPREAAASIPLVNFTRLQGAGP